MHSSALLLAAVGAVSPAPMQELLTSGDDQWLQVLGSPDGRFTEVDRPVVTEGGLPVGDHEVFINVEEREVLERHLGHRLAVGDTIDLSFWWGGLEFAITDLSTVVAPIGVERVRIAGFGRLPDEVLPDELYPRQRVIVSADLARKYSCTGDFRADMTDEEAFAAVLPEGAFADQSGVALRAGWSITTIVVTVVGAIGWRWWPRPCRRGRRRVRREGRHWIEGDGDVASGFR